MLIIIIRNQKYEEKRNFRKNNQAKHKIIMKFNKFHDLKVLIKKNENLGKKLKTKHSLNKFIYCLYMMSCMTQ
jgi:hypothetical protein